MWVSGIIPSKGRRVSFVYFSVSFLKRRRWFSFVPCPLLWLQDTFKP